ncbi:MAG: hypothetical protein A3E78_07170 [Alphaproteobacteria bacterium RIFCSPHIGHO2_12_FULL_63_12]|nr:MAG: hypothetical protein A3E78_07170 [Alphaproteobacteria bacterium RIFCSPHIGHO2_12_FULL_63_12]
MKIGKAVLSMAFGAAAMFAVSQASDVAPCPDDYQLLASNYVEGRLVDARGARVQIVSEPYRVAADMGSDSGVEGWGVDIKVRSRLPSGSYGGYVPYTVIFVDGVAVALCEDARDVSRV